MKSSPHSRLTLCSALSLILLISLLLCSGCGFADLKTERASADWSRGQRLGQAAVNDQVGLAVTSAGDSVYLVWVTRYERNGADLLHFARLDSGGRLVAEGDLAIGVDRPTEARLLLDAQGHLHLTWISQLGDVRRLFHARLEPSGQLGSYPRPLSGEGVSVDAFAVAPAAGGGTLLVWSAAPVAPASGDRAAGSGQGLYLVRVNTWGDTVGSSQLLRPSGFEPAMVAAGDGTAHLVWHEEPTFGEQSILYGVLDPEAGTLSREHRLTTFASPIGLLARRPSIGIAGDQVFVFWSRERRGGGMALPSAESFYTVFPAGSPEQAPPPTQVDIAPLYYPDVERVTASYRVSELARPGQSRLPARFVYLPAPAVGAEPPRAELAVAFAVEFGGRTKSTIQIANTLWSRGELLGYQIAAKTRNSSLKPALAADVAGELHLAWIDTAGFGAYDVYYASTAKAVQANLNRLTLADVAAALFDLLWAMVQGLGFLPMTLTWLFIPLAATAIYLFVTAEGDLARRGPRIMLAVAIVLYAAFKYLFRPSWLAALPLPRRTPTEVANALIFLAPLLVSGLAGLVAWLYVRKRSYATLLATFIIFAGTDALLTLLIYVPGVLRE